MELTFSYRIYGTTNWVRCPSRERWGPWLELTWQLPPVKHRSRERRHQQREFGTSAFQLITRPCTMLDTVRDRMLER